MLNGIRTLITADPHVPDSRATNGRRGAHLIEAALAKPTTAPTKLTRMNPPLATNRSQKKTCLRNQPKKGPISQSAKKRPVFAASRSRKQGPPSHPAKKKQNRPAKQAK